MFKSCKYCGRIHDVKSVCEHRPKKKRKELDVTDEMKVKIRMFRNSAAWIDKREEIQQRDMRMCQVCIRNLYNTLEQFNFENTSVHHIYGLVEDWEMRLDRSNLITLCSTHHGQADRGEIPKYVLLGMAKEQNDKHYT